MPIVGLVATVIGMLEHDNRVATVWARATLMAFSTASAPELNRVDFFSWSWRDLVELFAHLI